jgi:hypothetical protein
MMRSPSLSTVTRAKGLLAAAYLGAACYLFLSYWVLWERPILDPLVAAWEAQFGDINELPLGEDWTRHYTQGIRQSNGVGLIDSNALVYLPFPARSGTRKLEIELRSLFASPGYRTEVTILINDKPVGRAPVGYDWQTTEVEFTPKGGLTPANLKLQFNMEKVATVPRYAGAEVLRFEPGTPGFSVWRSGAWEPGRAESVSGPVRVERHGNLVSVGSERLQLDRWPLTVALAPWTSARLRHPFLAVELPTVACRTIRMR